MDALAKCSVCGRKLRADRIVILDEKERETVLHATCFNCKSASIIFLSSNQAGLVSVGMATDMDASEVKKIFGTSAISADEVIDAHELISHNDILQLVKNSN